MSGLPLRTPFFKRLSLTLRSLSALGRNFGLGGDGGGGSGEEEDELREQEAMAAAAHVAAERHFGEAP